MMEKLTFGRHAAKQLVAQIDISQKKFLFCLQKYTLPNMPNMAKFAYLGAYFSAPNMVK